MTIRIWKKDDDLFCQLVPYSKSFISIIPDPNRNPKMHLRVTINGKASPMLTLIVSDKLVGKANSFVSKTKDSILDD
jgi:hypothetical protein